MNVDDKIKELIAIGASVAGHCQPCLTYHIAHAKELGLEEDEIQAAIAVGHTVETGAMAAMREFSREALGRPQRQAASCCGSPTSKNTTSCCG